jgi:hypothetical protein
MAKAMVLVFALTPLNIRCTLVGDVEGGLKRNREVRRVLIRDARVLVSLQTKPGHLRVRTFFTTIDGAVQDQSS